jgi:hypothetical protein
VEKQKQQANKGGEAKNKGGGVFCREEAVGKLLYLIYFDVSTTSLLRNPGRNSRLVL